MQSRRCLQGTPAYFSRVSVTREKSFITFTAGAEHRPELCARENPEHLKLEAGHKTETYCPDNENSVSKLLILWKVFNEIKWQIITF